MSRVRFAAESVVILLVLWTVGPASADDQELREVREDCRSEGQMAGLEGTTLDDFVNACVADLMSVEFSNVAEPQR